MKKIFGESDVKLGILNGKKIAMLGYGSQGKAQALNLRDSGCNVVLGLRPNGKTAQAAKQDGWSVIDPSEAVKGADIVVILVPDMAQASLYKEVVAANLKNNAAILFSHGFNIHFKQIQAASHADVIMVAPKSPGHLVRRQYEEGRGVPCLVAVEQDATGQAFDLALAYAHAIGGTKAGVLQTTFAEETVTDLFGEQAVLCGGATELILAGFETLVNAGYQAELAYFECLHELKLIVDLIYEGGISRMLDFVSETAKYGDFTRGPRVVDERTRETMKKILTEIQSGQFAKEWTEEYSKGLPNYNAAEEKDRKHPIEQVGKELRSRMSWLKKGNS